MLEAGGNAMDAGVAAAFAATVTEQDHIGLGGEMPLLIKVNGKPVIAVISGVGIAGQSDGRFLSASRAGAVGTRIESGADSECRNSRGDHAGVVDGLLLALEKYGTMSFAKVVEPAIDDADGFPDS